MIQDLKKRDKSIFFNVMEANFKILFTCLQIPLEEETENLMGLSICIL